MTYTTNRLITSLFASAAFVAVPAAAQDTHQWGPQSAPQYQPAYDAQFRAPLVSTGYEFETRTIAEGLAHPWAIEALADGSMLVTERPGTLRHVAMDGTVSDPIAGVPEVYNQPPAGGGATQAGLLDVKAGPNFEEDRWVYLTFSKPVEDDMSVTAVVRGRLSDDATELTEVEEIWEQHPPSPTAMHYGSRIVFDDDGHAFITTGEHSSLMERDFSQHLETTYGKIIRVNLDGSIPEDNPFVGVEGADDAIWSYGHRNVQGAAMKDGFLYTIEHGPAGGDELNMPMPGRNYGWPIVSYGVRYTGPRIGSGEPRMAGMEEPLYYWDPVIAPGDFTFYEGDRFSEWEGDMLIGGLVARGIVRLELNGFLPTEEERVLTDFGRVRDVEVLADGSIVFATDYQDGEIVHAIPASDS